MFGDWAGNHKASNGIFTYDWHYEYKDSAGTIGLIIKLRVHILVVVGQIV